MMGTFVSRCCLKTQRVSAALLSAVLTLAVCTAVSSLLVVPGIRSAEAGESSPAKERNEDATHTFRQGSDRHLRPEGRHDRAVCVFHVPLQMGRDHAPTLPVPSGHRFANGLLAPLTC